MSVANMFPYKTPSSWPALLLHPKKTIKHANSFESGYPTSDVIVVANVKFYLFCCNGRSVAHRVSSLPISALSSEIREKGDGLAVAIGGGGSIKTTFFLTFPLTKINSPARWKLENLLSSHNPLIKLPNSHE